MNGKFVMEIPEDKITNELLTDYDSKGCTIKWKEDSVEIWLI